MIEITKDFTGGNIEVVSITDSEIVLKNEIRDTKDDWFYWAFCIKNAGGKTIKFKFDHIRRVGYFGAAVSHDLLNWSWTDSKIEGEGFTYTFKNDENCVYFAHSMLYHPARFDDFALLNHLEQKLLCITKKGRKVPFVTIGSGDKYIMLTARHHCCESTGSYVLEGVLQSLIDQPIDGYSIFCVPFVDYDGVVDGDQGKNRIPYDHNRDYDMSKPAIYETVAKIREFGLSHNVKFGFDFHSPWHYGEGNDYIAITKKSLTKCKHINSFSKCFVESMTKNALQYGANYDIEPGVGWNKVGTPCFGTFALDLMTSDIGFTLETPYYGIEEDRFTGAKAVETGHCFANALRKYIKQKQTAKISFTGDLLCYPDMTENSKTEDGFDYSPILTKLKSELVDSDCAVGNLETPIAGKAKKYTYERYRFNTPLQYLKDLQAAGIDTVCLANNHCMDRGEQGLLNTINACKELKIDYCGVCEHESEKEKILVKNINGTRVALLNFTYGTNAFAHHTFLQSEHKYMVKLTQPEETLDGAINLLESNDKIAENVKQNYNPNGQTYKNITSKYLLNIKKDIEKAKQIADVVIFCLHSGGQYNTLPDDYTKMLFEKIYSFGADLVVGLHPHIIQSCGKIGNMPAIYCLGNCVFSPEITNAASEIDKSYNALLHVNIENKIITQISFSLMYVHMSGNIPVCENTFDICASHPNKCSEVLKIAAYFAGDKKYDKISREYVLYTL